MLHLQKILKLSKITFASLILSLLIPNISESACSSRGSGTRTGEPLDLYYPAQDECPGGLSDSSTDSYRINFSVLRSSAINSLLQPGNTNYIIRNGESSCESETPDRVGDICIQSNAHRIWIATSTSANGYDTLLSSQSVIRNQQSLPDGTSYYVSQGSATSSFSGTQDIYERLGLSSSNVAGFLTILAKINLMYSLGITSNPTNGRWQVIVATNGQIGINSPITSLTGNNYFTVLSFGDNSRDLVVFQNEGSGVSFVVGDESGDQTPFLVDKDGGFYAGLWAVIRGSTVINSSLVATSSTFGGADGYVYTSTNGVISSSRQCPFGFKRTGGNVCSDSDGVPHMLIVSSAVSAGGSGNSFVTYDIPALSTAQASAIEIEVKCDVTNDGGAGDSFISPNARVTGGGGIGPGSAATRKPGQCNQSVASQNNYCQATFHMLLGTNNDIDLAVELTAATSGTCAFYVIKVWD